MAQSISIITALVTVIGTADILAKVARQALKSLVASLVKPTYI